MRVQVTQGGETFLGVVETTEQAQHPTAGLTTRLTVHREDNGVKVYAWPGVDSNITEAPATEPSLAPEASLAHLAPPADGTPSPAVAGEPVQYVGSGQAQAPAPVVRQGSAPPVGSSIGGVPTPMVPAAMAAAAVAPSLPSVPVDNRFMVQPKKGSPQTYHTRDGCPRVPVGSRTMSVTDETIEFFALDHCQVCKRRESQISWEEAVVEAIEEAGTKPGATAISYADAVVKALGELGFRVSPDTVDRIKADEA